LVTVVSRTTKLVVSGINARGRRLTLCFFANTYVRKPAAGPEEQAVSRSLFPVGKRINDDYVMQLYGLETQTWTKEQFTEAVENITTIRTEARSYAKGHCESRALTYVKNLGVNVSSMKELKRKFAEDGSTLFAAKVWAACYNPFENDWELEGEKECLAAMNLTYKEAGGERLKGCFARLFVDIKKEMCKAINKATLATHGGQIRMKRTKEEVVRLGVHKKRKKGTVVGGWYSLAIDDLMGPGEILQKELQKELQVSRVVVCHMCLSILFLTIRSPRHIG
jgi:hypothetical protein